MVQVRQGIGSAKPNSQRINFELTEATSLTVYTTPYHEMHIKVEHIIKLYTDDTGQFSVCSQIVNQYMMISYHCCSNVTIDAPFKSRADKHILLAYGAIMQRLKDRNMILYLQIVDKEAINKYKRIIKAEWVVGYELVPLHIHRRNAAERSIRTFKACFLSILSGIAKTFSKNLWDLLIPQTELTINP